MNYEKIHHLLIEKADNRILPKGTYTEKHHITPKCLDGDNSQDNLVLLLPEEHFLIHQLLVKMYPGHKNLIYACNQMSGKSAKQLSRNNKMYGWLKRRHSKVLSDIARNRVNPFKGLKHSEETKEKMRQIALNRKIHPSLGHKHSEESKKRMSEAKIGKKAPHSDETKQKMRERRTKQVICPHCKKKGGLAGMKVWHFDNCKLLYL